MPCISLNVSNYGRIANHIQSLYYDVKIFKVVMENAQNKILKTELPWSISHFCKPLIYKGRKVKANVIKEYSVSILITVYTCKLL